MFWGYAQSELSMSTSSITSLQSPSVPPSTPQLISIASAVNSSIVDSSNAPLSANSVDCRNATQPAGEPPDINGFLNPITAPNPDDIEMFDSNTTPYENDVKFADVPINPKIAIENTNVTPYVIENLKGSSDMSTSLTLNFMPNGIVGQNQNVVLYPSAVTTANASPELSAALSPTQLSDRELRSIAQQTEISCKVNTIPGIIGNRVLDPETARLVRARIADSLTHSSPPSSVLQPPRSTSILGSVCALLLSKQNSAAAKEVPSYTGTAAGSDDGQICRICFGGASSERLVRPCSCRGTIAAVHRSCLERWLLQANTSFCELCRHHYVVTRSHKWSWVMSLCAWLVSGRGRALAADAWRGAALGACSVLGTARALHACDVVLQAGARRGGSAALAANLFSSFFIGIIGALNGLLTTWMLLKVQEHQLSWQAWRDSTLHVRVRLDDDPSPPAATPPLPRVSPHASSATVVAAHSHSSSPIMGRSTVERATNVADPFMVAVPYSPPAP